MRSVSQGLPGVLAVFLFRFRLLFGVFQSRLAEWFDVGYFFLYDVYMAWESRGIKLSFSLLMFHA